MSLTKSQFAIAGTCDRVKNLLLEKNAKYGDSALNPSRIFSKASASEQLLVRIDDKLSRVRNGCSIGGDDEDVVLDLIGYLILLLISKDNSVPVEEPAQQPRRIDSPGSILSSVEFIPHDHHDG